MLVVIAITCNSTGNNLSPLRDKLPQEPAIFIINRDISVGAKPAYLLASSHGPPARRAPFVIPISTVSRFKCHFYPFTLFLSVCVSEVLDRFFRIPITTQALLRWTHPLAPSLPLEVPLWGFQLMGWPVPRPRRP